MSLKEYEEEIIFGVKNIKNHKNLIQIYTFKNKIKTVLPRPEFNEDSSKFEGLIMVSVKN